MYQEQDIDLESTWIVSQLVALGTCEEVIRSGLSRLARDSTQRCPVLVLYQIMIPIINMRIIFLSQIIFAWQSAIVLITSNYPSMKVSNPLRAYLGVVDMERVSVDYT